MCLTKNWDIFNGVSFWTLINHRSLAVESLCVDSVTDEGGQ